MTAPSGRVLERRMFATEFRDVTGSKGRQKWATAVTYNRVDDFGTIWLPSCFNEGLDERMPTILYGHDWYTLDHVLGQGIDYKDTPAGCDVLFEFADPELVPPAARAMALTAGPNPILKDVSVGFDRQEWIRKDDLDPAQLEQGAEEAMVRAVMDELSIVVRGAVPDAQMRTRRSWVIDGTVATEPPRQVRTKGAHVDINGTMVDVDLVVDLARRRAAGEMSMDEARAALDLVAGGTTVVNVTNVGTGEERASLGLSLGDLDDADEGTLRCHLTLLEARMADLFSSDQRQMLRDALNDRFQPGPDRYIWVVDFTDTHVVFEMSGFDDSGMFMLAYTIDNDQVTLDPGDPVGVTTLTTYVPEPEPSMSGTAGGDEGEQRVSVPSDDVIDAALATAGRARR